MGLGQVEAAQGVGRGVVGLIRLWKCVENSKAPGAKPAPRAPDSQVRHQNQPPDGSRPLMRRYVTRLP